MEQAERAQTEGNPLTEERVSTLRRLRQHQFRKRVLENFASRCAICSIGEARLLEAAHVRPWAQYPEGREAVRNGILLCALHHRAFDAALLHLSQEGKVFVHRLLRKRDGWEKTWFTDYHEKPFSKGHDPIDLSSQPRWWKLLRDEQKLEGTPEDEGVPDEP